MNSKLYLKFFVVGIAILSTKAYADTIYEYVDKNGVTVFTNKPPANVHDKKIFINNKSSTYNFSGNQSSTNYKAEVVTKNSSNKEIQNSKSQILQNELKNEKQSLADAQEAYEKGKAERLGNERNYQKYLDRVQSLKDEVTLHQKTLKCYKNKLINKGLV